MENEKRLTPLKAIRKYCLWCHIDSHVGIKLCPSANCSLHPYRFGHRNQDAKLTPCKAIKAKCTDCSGYNAAERNNCTYRDCQLYEFRNGNNPARKSRNNICNLKNLAKNNDTINDFKYETPSQV